MKIHEYQANLLFQKAGLPVVAGQVTTTVEEALTFAAETGYPVVLKSQVHVGGRGKAGGIKLVRTEDELKAEYQRLKTLMIKGYAVEKIFVVRAIDIKKEYYLAVAVDAGRNDVVCIASAAGGVDIEETAKNKFELILDMI